jgi:hypothetical protein
LEALFLDAVGDCADNLNLLDYYRLQSNPSRQSSWLKCPEINTIIAATQSVVDTQCSGYVLKKLSVLYSRPNGQPQGIHVDDPRPINEIVNEGEMISAIFALQDDTKLDIGLNNQERKTYSIPSGSMFLFSGKCWHGGAVHPSNNVRIHMYFGPKLQSHKQDNTIAVGYTCPVNDCFCNIGRIRSFTKSQIYNHWRLHHKHELVISLDKYRKHIMGHCIYECSSCHKGYLSQDGLKRHKRTRCKK